MPLRVLQAMAGQKQGGAEAFFERLAGALQRSGVDQRLVIRRDTGRAERLRRRGVDTYELSFGGTFDVATRLGLAFHLRQYQPDVVLSWMSRAAAMMPPRWLAGDRAVRVGRLGGYYNLKYYRGCDHLIGNTEDIVDYIRRRGWPAERAHYLPNFADVASAPPADRAALQTPPDAIVALALGRFHLNKAFDVLLDAMATTPGLYLWIGGDGELRGELEAQIQRLGLSPRVRLLGWRDDVPSLLAACDIAVCPSRHEPLGNVVLEAWAHQRPIVAAASAGPDALIDDEQTGLLVPIDEPAALAAALQRLAGDAALRTRLAASGHAAYQAGFSEASVVRRYVDFLQRVAR